MPSGNGSNADVLAKSVTADDYNDSPRAGTVLHFMLPGFGAAPDLPAFWSYGRDWVLYSTIYRESMWAAAVYIAVTKQASKSFEVESDIPKRQKDGQRLFLSFDHNRGWVGGISKHLFSYILTGNGGPVEIVRATGAPGSRILGLIPLDPFRTIRTGDPRIPFVYRDRVGREHEMKDYEAFAIADSPDPMDLWYGVGHCAAERAYSAVIKLEAIERYIYEKVTGKRALALDFISGVLPQQIKDAQDSSRMDSASKGVTTYLGSTIIALAGDIAPTHVRVNLAELPDGFQRKEEFDIALLTYARAIGIPVQDLQPLSGQGLGTGTQSQVLEESAKGQGLATWNKAFSHAVNEYALDEKTTFYFRENDIRDREREAKLRIDEATAISTWVQMQSITIEQARQLGVDRDQLPREFLEVDLTAGDAISDSEKPVDVSEITPQTTEVPVLETPSEPPVATDSILKQAREIYNAVAGKAPPTDPLLPRLLDTQERLIDLLSRPASDTKERGDLAEGITQALDIAGKRLETLSGTVESIQSSAATNSDVQALRHALKVAQESAERRTSDEQQALASAFSEIITGLQAAHESQVALTGEQLKALTERVNALASPADTRAMVERALESTWDNVQFKHAEDLAASLEVVETNSDGLAIRVRRTSAGGEVSEYKAEWVNGKKRWVRL